ncbi:hypothetical protein RHSIM_RhsimUnG0040300 [Rhododendron simsii]|uniref:Uncharacterized protein n=1 Tax=Rhododendron simsii TaxID=118357 RepID=A0A834L5N5_RHOSS|nr:hypothetical protein RHSIM_RhsimUnG0040300 [Rhododendron simsii]
MDLLFDLLIADPEDLPRPEHFENRSWCIRIFMLEEELKGAVVRICKQAELEAAGVDVTVMKAMAMSLYGPKQKANGKTTKEGKNRVGHGTGDEEFLPPEGEENLSVYSDDDESSS